MKWCLDFNPPGASFSMGPSCAIYLAGSCFAFEWGKRLHSVQWPAQYHPLHITYQPQALRNQLRFILGLSELNPDHWVNVGGRWRHLNVHSALSDPKRELAESKIQVARERAYAELQKSEYVILTLGAAHSYTFLETGEKVANCHKMPQANFQGALEDPDAIQGQIFDIQAMLSSLPNFRESIWTVSPVRHIRLGLIENQRSKARLITAVEKLTKQVSKAHYFPAYEWLIDVLRDYRFYTSDLSHPSDQAVEFILHKFSGMYFSTEAQELMSNLNQYYRFSQHRPQAINQEEHEKKRETMKARLNEAYPNLNLD